MKTRPSIPPSTPRSHGRRGRDPFAWVLLAVVALPVLAHPHPGEAQLRDPVRVSGQATAVSDFYAGTGVNRWPGAAWRMNLSPQATLFGGVGVGFDILLSSNQSEFRQNINQVGISPSWSWGTLHLGDFSRDYSRYLLQGTRIRGAGIELRRTGVAFEMQGGRAQRSVTMSELGEGATAFRRTLMAARLRVGQESRSRLEVAILSGRDDPGQADQVIVVPDTLLLDTIPLDLRPISDTRPQENLAAALGGQLALGGRFLVLRGQVAASLITRDILADPVSASMDELAVPSRLYPTLERLHDMRLSTGFDQAWEVEATLTQGPGRLRAGYEHVGPGFASMGLPSFLPDRRGYRADVQTRHLEGRLALQGQLRHQANNLAGQLRNTVERNTVGGTVMARPSEVVSLTFTGMMSHLENDASSDSAKVNNRALATSGNVSVQQEIGGRNAVVGVGYTYQEAADRSPRAMVPRVTTHNVTGSVQVALTPAVSLTPSVSAVTTGGEGIDRSRNLFLGFRGSGRFLEGDLRTSASVTQTVSQGRNIFNSQFQVSHPLGWGTEGRFQARHNRFGAFAERPGFRESFATLSLVRSF
jgi:hypothetical protein